MHTLNLSQWLTEYSQEWITVTTRNGVFVYLSPSSQALLGLDASAWIGRSITRILHPDDLPAYQQVIPLEHPKQVTWRLTHQDGRDRWFEITLRQIEGDQVLWVACDVTDRREINALKRENERLQRALARQTELNALKSRLIQGISQEFRSPLTVLMNTYEMLHKYDSHLDAAQRQAYMDEWRDQINVLTQIVKDIGLLIQHDPQLLVFEDHPLDLLSLCQRMLHRVRDRYGMTYEFSFFCDGNDHVIEGNEKLFSYVLNVLIENAIKYAAPQTEIQVELYRKTSYHVIRVSDQGMGPINATKPTALLPLLRQKGVALNIARECIALHGGTLNTESVYGKGNTVLVSIPMRAS
ncbi:MAG: PAS domain-containing sensor histidine kinase [Anaerolineae bacterium]|nr:PAS domain-containing sensor histidine kinase [Anaerolineae bacterium]